MKKVAYMRVSTQKQDLSRQYEEFKKLGVSEKNIYEDKQSGKNFERLGYNYMKRALEKGDILIVSSLDRLRKKCKRAKRTMAVFQR